VCVPSKRHSLAEWAGEQRDGADEVRASPENRGLRRSSRALCGQSGVCVMGIATSLLAVALWTGTAQVDVMISEGGGEHPYTTDFTLQYRETSRTPVRDANGVVVGHRVRLAPQRVVLKALHEVRGLSNCTGGGEEVVTDAPEAEVVVPISGKDLTAAVGLVAPPTGTYQLVLPRAVGAFACGNKRNTRDRRVAIGTGLFHADVEVADVESRSLESDGARMRGEYEERHERHFGDSTRHVVRYQFNVKWDLRRVVE
jgi:hypothetical protein